MAIIALILGTGIRVSECAGVDLQDLNLKEAVLDVTRKGGQKDSVPIAEWTLSYIKQYKDIRTDRYMADQKPVSYTHLIAMVISKIPLKIVTQVAA